MNKENVMGTGSVPGVMIKMAIPVIISMLLQACYNIVDSVFVSRMPDTAQITGMGEYGVNALTLAFPLQMIIGAFGIGTGVGVNALVSRSLGEADREKAGKAAGNGLFAAFIFSLMFVAVGFFVVDIYVRSQTSDPVSIFMCSTYLSINMFVSFGMVFFGIFEKLLQSTGKTVYSTIAQICGAATNIILDPIMIFGLIGFPALGIAGAAWATVIGQVVSMIVACVLHFKKNKEVPSGLKYLKPEGHIMKGIFAIALPAIIMQALMSVMSYGINLIFGSVSTAAVTAYGIFFKIEQFLLFALFGLRDVITPVIAYNYGAGYEKRVRQGIKYGVLFCVIVMTGGTIAFEFFAPALVSMFNLSDHSAELCIRALRIIGSCLIFVGINMALQGVFQALNSGFSSLVVSLLRMLVIVLPLAYIFSLMPAAEHLIWLSIPIAEVISAIVAIILTKRLIRRTYRKQEKP